MTNYINVTSDLYIHKSDVQTIGNGGEVEAYINVSDPNEYELINKYAFQPSIKVDSNTFLVTFIME